MASVLPLRLLSMFGAQPGQKVNKLACHLNKKTMYLHCDLLFIPFKRMTWKSRCFFRRSFLSNRDSRSQIWIWCVQHTWPTQDLCRALKVLACGRRFYLFGPGESCPDHKTLPVAGTRCRSSCLRSSTVLLLFLTSQLQIHVQVQGLCQFPERRSTRVSPTPPAACSFPRPAPVLFPP